VLSEIKRVFHFWLIAELLIVLACIYTDHLENRI